SPVAVLFHLVRGNNRDRRWGFGGGLFASRRPCDTEFLEVLQAQGKYISRFFCGPFTSAQLCSERAEQQQTGGQIPTNIERPSERFPATDRVHGFGLVETSPECLRPAMLHQMMADVLHSARRSLEKWAGIETGVALED